MKKLDKWDALILEQCGGERDALIAATKALWIASGYQRRNALQFLREIDTAMMQQGSDDNLMQAVISAEHAFTSALSERALLPDTKPDSIFVKNAFIGVIEDAIVELTR